MSTAQLCYGDPIRQVCFPPLREIGMCQRRLHLLNLGRLYGSWVRLLLHRSNMPCQFIEIADFVLLQEVQGVPAALIRQRTEHTF